MNSILSYKNTSLALATISSLTMMACGPTNNDDNAKTNTAQAKLIECSDFGSDLTLTDDVDGGVDYIVDCEAAVRGELIIEPGVIIQFKEDAGFDVSGEGTITAEGTAEKPIVFTAEEQVAGFWKGFYISSGSVKNKLDHVEFEYAGGDQFNSNGDKGSIILYADGQLSLTNSLITKSANFGLNNNYEAELTFSNNTITESELQPISIEANLMGEIDSESQLTGNGKDFVRVTSGYVEDIEATWKKLTVPYQIKSSIDISGESAITVEAGAEFVFAEDTGIEVSDGSYFAAQGTAEEHVIFTGEVEEKGSWNGFLFHSNDVKNSLDYVTVDYAGGGSFNSNDDRGAVMMYADSRLILTNSTISNSKEYGFNVNYSVEDLTFSNNTITGCEKEPVAVQVGNIHQLDSESQLTGNTKDYVRLHSSYASATGVTGQWNKLTVPYLFAADTDFNITDESVVNVEAGTEFRFAANAGLEVDDDSSFSAVGTSEAKIQFLGIDETAESWKGIMFYSNDTKNRLEHVNIKYAGSGSFNSNGDEGGLIIYADAQVTIKDVEISDSGDCAISAEYESSVLIEEGTNVLTGLLAGICLPD